MKVLQINSFGNLSTGRIAVDLYRTLVSEGHEGIVAFARNSIADDVSYIKIGSDWDVKIHGLMTRITDKTGFYSEEVTKKLIKEIKDYNPDVVQLHNIHGYYLNIEVLFNFLKSYGKPVIWTLHDCWSYTGHCCHYSMVQCYRWKSGCYNCVQKDVYPASILFDNSKWNYQRKKELFTGMKNMTIVAVSKWLAGEIRQSFMKEYPLKVIYNGIDLKSFCPTESDLREKYDLWDKIIILGAASTWARKGLNDFIKLSQMLDNRYKIIVVGVNDKEKALLPDNMIGISRINSIQDLAGLYTAADVFFNASVEETFGLTTVEAMACGTPVIVYDETALPEVVDENCGLIVKAHDLDTVVAQVENVIHEKSNVRFLLERARDYEANSQYKKYVELYKEMLK